MRPPDLPGGNSPRTPDRRRGPRRFNEAAGFTRRKRVRDASCSRRRKERFNEAAGFTRRKLSEDGNPIMPIRASMRPPDLPGGNTTRAAQVATRSGELQ